MSMLDGTENLDGNPDELEKDPEELENEPNEEEEGTDPVDPPDDAAVETEPVEAAPAEANWIKDLRKRHKDDAKRLRELEEENKRLKAPAKVESMPVEPALSDDGIDYDEAKFKAAVKEYTIKTLKYEQAQNAEKEAVRAKEEAAKAIYAAYQTKAAALDVNDFEEAQDEVVAALSEQQQAVLLEAADNPALVVYQLFESPEKLHELKNIKSLAKFAVAVGIMEKNLKQPQNRQKPPPEGVLRGGTSGTATAALEALHREAVKTGDFSKYHAAKFKK